MGLVSVKGLAGKVRVYRVTGESGATARALTWRGSEASRAWWGGSVNWRCSSTASHLPRRGVARPSRSLATPGWANRACCMSSVRRSPVLTASGLRAAVTLTAQCWPISPSLILSSSTAGLTPVTETRTFGAKSTTDWGSSGWLWRQLHHLSLHLLAVETEGRVLVGPSPEAVKHQTFEALRGLVGEIAARGPLVLTIEDLHWADATSAEFLAFLLEHLAGSRILLVCTYRPDFASLWSGKSYHSVITLPPSHSLRGVRC